jgi:hypothetical protein
VRRSRLGARERAGVRSVRIDVVALVERLEGRTRRVFTEAQGSERHARLCQRLERLYGALEFARLLEQGALARWIEAHLEAVRREIEAD